MTQRDVPLALLRFEKTQLAVRECVFWITGQGCLQEVSRFTIPAPVDICPGKTDKPSGQSRLLRQCSLIAFSCRFCFTVSTFQVSICYMEKRVVRMAGNRLRKNLLSSIEVSQ